MRRMSFRDRLKQAKELLRYQGFLGKYELAARQGITPTYAEMILKVLAEEMPDEIEFHGDAIWMKSVLEERSMEPAKLRQSTLDERALYIDR